MDEEVRSPCVSICVLDENDVCVGCYRSGDEVTKWWDMDNDEKLQVLENTKQREKKSYI